MKDGFRLQKILVAVDGSAATGKAITQALQLAKVGGAQLVILHVIEDIKMGGAIGARAKYGDIKLIEGYKKARKESAIKWMTSIEERIKNEGIELKSEIQYDTGKSVTGMIVDYAEKNRIDLIVLGTRGFSGFKRLLLGSVASGVSSHAHCPVLVAR